MVDYEWIYCNICDKNTRHRKQNYETYLDYLSTYCYKEQNKGWILRNLNMIGRFYGLNVPSNVVSKSVGHETFVCCDCSSLSINKSQEHFYILKSKETNKQEGYGIDEIKNDPELLNRVRKIYNPKLLRKS